MTLDSCLLLLAGLGHFCLTVLLVNGTHGSGLHERSVHRLTAFWGILFLAVVAAAAWNLPGRPLPDWPWVAKGYAVVCLGVACLGLPLVTLLRGTGRPVAGIGGDRVEIDFGTIHGADKLVGTLRKSALLRLPGNEAFRLEFNDWTIECLSLPPELDGLTILHLTDLHLARTYDRRFFEAVADAASEWDADLVLFTGDLVDDEGAVPWIAPILGRIRGRLGAYAILGNHDCQFDPARLHRELERGGFQVVDGTWTTLDIEGCRVAIGGTSAPWGPKLEPSGFPDDADARILLSHTPDLLGRAAQWGVDLMFSGHNHGGQVRLPLLGPVLMPSRYGRRYDQGFFRKRQTLLYVGRGIAAKHPIRYRCTPEISRFKLRTSPAVRTQPEEHTCVLIGESELG
jgi:predicted MPP superfamily phosphohydrolase